MSDTPDEPAKANKGLQLFEMWKSHRRDVLLEEIRTVFETQIPGVVHVLRKRNLIGIANTIPAPYVVMGNKLDEVPLEELEIIRLEMFYARKEYDISEAFFN